MATTRAPEVERQAIVEVALDYFEGWFTGDAERMRRALHPQLAKRRLADDAEGLKESTANGMIAATAAGDGVLSGDAGEIAVEVVEVYDGIATAVVRSSVYREYLHLVRMSEGWRIANALWAFTSEEGG